MNKVTKITEQELATSDTSHIGLLSQELGLAIKHIKTVLPAQEIEQIKNIDSVVKSWAENRSELLGILSSGQFVTAKDIEPLVSGYSNPIEQDKVDAILAAVDRLDFEEATKLVLAVKE